MKRHSLVGVALVAAMFVVSGCKEEGVTFTRKAPGVGQRFKHQQRMDMQMSLAAVPTPDGGEGQPLSVTSSSQVTKTIEVLANDEKAATKLKVAYEDKRDLNKQGDQEKKSVSPVVGKTYLVEAKEGRIQVTDEQGQPVSPAEVREVTLDNKDLGKVDSMAMALPDRPLKVGEEVPELSRAIELALTRGAPVANPSANAAGTKVKLREVKGDLVLFDVAAVFSQVNGPMTIKMDLTGTLGIRKSDAQPMELSLKGPVKLELASPPGAAPPPANAGSGEMSMVIAAQPL